MLNLPGKCIKTPGSLCFWKSNTHPRHKRRMQDNTAYLIAGSQINGWYSADALTIQYDILCTNTEPFTKALPRCFNVSIEITFRNTSRAPSITTVVICHNITSQTGTKTDQEARHLSQINCVSMTTTNNNAANGLTVVGSSHKM